MSFVSVIIPFYNAEKYISQSIESVLNQSYADWELILINDGSTDNSKNIAKQYLNEAKVKYFEQINQGQASARNLGIKNASSELIAFLDADDVWMPDKLETQMPLLTNAVDLVFSNAQIIDQEGKPIGDYLNPGSGFFSGYTAFDYLIKGQYFIPTLTVICRRSKIYEVGFFDERGTIRNAEDFDLWARMLLNGAIFFGVDRCTANYRVHVNQASAKDPANTIQVVESLLAIKRHHLQHKHTINRAIISRLSVLGKSDVFDSDNGHEMLKRVFPRFWKLHVLFYKFVGAKNYDRCSAWLYPLVCP